MNDIQNNESKLIKPDEISISWFGNNFFLDLKNDNPINYFIEKVTNFLRDQISYEFGFYSIIVAESKYQEYFYQDNIIYLGKAFSQNIGSSITKLLIKTNLFDLILKSYRDKCLFLNFGEVEILNIGVKNQNTYNIIHNCIIENAKPKLNYNESNVSTITLQKIHITNKGNFEPLKQFYFLNN